jgi:SAM-dependent methyltransferase
MLASVQPPRPCLERTVGTDPQHPAAAQRDAANPRVPVDTAEVERINLANWEARVPIHAASQTYGLQAFVDDPSHLSSVVAFDAPHLGDLTGRRAVHLQCHIGTDTLSLARLGATTTGVDFSPSALAVARDLAERAGPAVRYVEASVEQVPERLPEVFDVVYTGVGALCWLPSVTTWASVVAGLLVPGGRLYLREGHPVLWSLAYDRDDDLLVLDWPYFEAAGPQREEDPSTYTDGGDAVVAPVTYETNHGLGETVQAVLDTGLRITRLVEHTFVEWPALPGMIEDPDVPGRYRFPDERRHLVPLMYTLEACKPGWTDTRTA